MTNVTDLNEWRRRQQGYFPVADMPTRGSVSHVAKDCGWAEFDDLYRIYPGQFTVVTGIAGHGKSTFMLNLLCRWAERHGLRSLLYVPENEMHLRDKLKRIWADPKTFDFFASGQCFVQSCSPDFYDQDTAQHLPWLFGRAAAVLEQDQIDIVFIDPWNEIEHAKPRDLSMTDYIRDALMYVKSFARKFNVAVIMVVHPTKAVFDAGKARVPSLADCESSMSWYNKADNGLIVHRNFETGSTMVVSAKVRERGAGRIGSCMFYFDEENERYTPQVRDDRA
jgi:twinkle protein